MPTIVFMGSEGRVDDWAKAVWGDPEILSYGTLIYLVHDGITPAWISENYNATTYPGRSSSQLKAFDGGVEITRGADYTTTAQLLNEAPQPGEVRWYTLGPTYIRLGSEPVFDLRVIAFGYPGQTSPGWRARDKIAL